MEKYVCNTEVIRVPNEGTFDIQGKNNDREQNKVIKFQASELVKFAVGIEARAIMVEHIFWCVFLLES